MTYKYLYQNRENQNLEGEIKARNRAEAYAAIRKLGIRPYRVIGDDPKNWTPWLIAAGYLVLTVITIIACVIAFYAETGSTALPRLSEEEAIYFREKCEDEVSRAPESFKLHMWEIMNERLRERGLKPLEKPVSLTDGF